MTGGRIDQPTLQKSAKDEIFWIARRHPCICDDVNVKFNPQALKGTIQRLLMARNLLEASSPHTIDIEITDIRVRSSFAAVMFGFFAGSDSVVGDVHVKDGNGRQLTRYEVSASYALGGLAGQDDARMGWLDEEFAKRAVSELSAENRK